MVTDTLVLAFATLGAMVAKFGLESSEKTWGSLELTYPQFGVVIALMWSSMLSVFESRDQRVLGRGLEEYRRIGRATAFTFGSVAVVSVILKVDFSRMYIAVALPLGLTTLVVSRMVWRSVLSRRTNVSDSTPVLVVGSEESSARIAEAFERDSNAAYRCVGAWSPSDHTSPVAPSVALRKRFEELGAAALIVTDPHTLGHEGIRALRWNFHDVEVLVAPHVFDVTPGRVALSYVGGETLVRLGAPRFERACGMLKGVFDRITAATLLLLLSPAMLVIAVAVKATSPGPAFFRQVRVGRNGRPFSMWKFRSMRLGAERELVELMAAQGTGSEPLFKPADDPRITTVGRVIRRFSLDELPQLFNVLNGTMSLVGPRPQVPEEVALYEGLEVFRLKVRPGITGLWQVSGRSNLSWQEAVRLDVYYVENWSVLVDLIILMRTLRVVMRADGAR